MKNTAKAKKKEKFYWHSFDLPMFMCTINVLFSDKWHEEARRIDGGDPNFRIDDSIKAMTTWEVTKGEALVDLYFTEDTNSGAIAHECFHVLVRFAHRFNQPIEADYDEFAAYILQYMVDKCTIIHALVRQEKKDARKSKEVKLEKLCKTTGEEKANE